MITMYTIAKNVQIVIALLKAHNIKKIVINPGGTNPALIRGVQDDDFFECYSIVDERSALYFAIGMYLETGDTIAICCTSAQATRNFIPGLTEAYYKHVPILAITFSKHPHYTYQEYMQAPDQTSLPKDAVKKSFALPYVTNQIDELTCARMVNEAILELRHKQCAPIQICVPMLDTELMQDTEPELPKVKVINRFYDNKELSNITNKKILIVVGENRGIYDKRISDFARATNSVIYANHLSNYWGDNVVRANLLLSSIDQEEFDSTLAPDILISIGGQTGDYPFFLKLSKSNKTYEHWRIAEDGAIVDTYDRLTKVFECTVEDFFTHYSVENNEINYYNDWCASMNRVNNDMTLPLSNFYLAQQLTPIIPESSIVHFAILNSLRSWNLFNFSNKVNCFSNVAAFGIDGCMSTFVGQSISTRELCYLVIGDLAFFYDMNALGIKYIGNNVRIILVNNNGGVEFKLWSGEEQNRKLDRYIAAANHFRTAEGWAITNDFLYIPIRNETELESKKHLLVNEVDKPVLFEVFTDDGKEGKAYMSIIKQLASNNFSKRAFNKIKSILK